MPFLNRSNSLPAGAIFIAAATIVSPASAQPPVYQRAPVRYEMAHGACCYTGSNGGLCRVLSYTQCNATGGGFRGPSSPCNPHPCAAVILGTVQGPGGNWYPIGMSGDGGTVIGATPTPTQYGAGVWRAGDNWNLLTAPASAGAPAAVSYDGSKVVGALRNTGPNQTSNYSGYLWTIAQGTLFVPAHPAMTDAKPLAISPDGSRIFGKYTDNQNHTRAARWDGSNWSFFNLGGLPMASMNARATACTNSGSYAGTSNSSAGYRAYRNGTALGGNFISGTAAMSNDGSVVVGYGLIGNANHAIRWNGAGVPTDLHTSSIGLSNSVATDCTADGATIVGDAWQGTSHSAFIWRAGSGMIKLKDYLRTRFNLIGYEFTNVTGISDDGRSICGYDFAYFIPGSTHRSPWIVRLPAATP